MLDLQKLQKYPITAVTITIACVVSLAYWAGINIDALRMSYVPLEQQPWTLFTSALPHVNFVHLLLNCYWLWVMGTWFEHRYGRARTIAYMALWAAGSALAEFALLDGGIGLSGVGYAMWAFFSVLRRRRYLTNGPVGEREDQLFVAWFFLCIVLTYSRIMPVGNLAHGAGAIFGALSAMSICGNRKLWTSATVVLLLVLLLAGTALRPQISFSTGYANYYTQTLAHEAWQLRDQERWPEAEAMSRQVLDRNPRDAEQWASHGGVLIELERESEAGEAYERAIALAPNNSYVRRAVAWWHDRLAGRAIANEDYRTAAEQYQLACNLQPGRARYRRGLAHVHDRLENIAAARESYEILLQLEPDDELAKARLEELAK